MKGVAIHFAGCIVEYSARIEEVKGVWGEAGWTTIPIYFQLAVTSRSFFVSPPYDCERYADPVAGDKERFLGFWE